MEQVLSTDEVGPRDRLAYWREVICATFIRLEVTQAEAGRFRGMVRTRHVGSVQATRIITDPMAAERTRRHLTSTEDDRCLLALQLRGRTIGRQDGRTAVLGPGDLALFDSIRPYRVDFEGSGFDHLVLQFPRAALTERGVEPRQATARRIALDSAIGRLTSPFLVSAARVAEATSPATSHRLGETSLDLISTALATTIGLDRSPCDLPAEETLRRIQLHMCTHLSNPRLSPADVAAAHHISVRQLHRLFAREGTTFGRWLRTERLRRCFDDLGSAQLAERSIAEIGARWGLPDPSGLSRAFRTRYRMSPRAFRRHALDEQGTATAGSRFEPNMDPERGPGADTDPVGLSGGVQVPNRAR